MGADTVRIPRDGFYDVLGKVKDTDVVSIDGQNTFQTQGTLRMTTVSLTDDVSVVPAETLTVSSSPVVSKRSEPSFSWRQKPRLGSVR